MPDDPDRSLRAKGMKGRPMRWVFCAPFLLLVSPAVAADLDADVLRGPEIVAPAPLPVGPATLTRWSGFYAGGQFGLSNANADFSNSTQALVAYTLRDTTLEDQQAPSQWPVLGIANQSAIGYGAFAGYNTQWQDLVLGMEANFNRAAFSLHAPSSPIARTTSDSTGSVYAVNFTGNGSVADQDFATLRLRAGWVAGNFLPYGFVGFALGVANTNVSVTGLVVQYTSGTVGVCTVSQPCGSQAINNGFTANSQVLYGFTVGGGVDVALIQNIFLRAEFEFDQFNPPPHFLMTVATGRVGAGFKF
jgi:outer membrane immunogenic protein